MKFSIITVCYNSENTIERTIQSVLAQDYADIEYILVDGNSKDNTLNIIKKYEPEFMSKGIEYKYISEQDSGMYDAINKGIKMATGEIIAVLNSDDWYEKDAIGSVMQSVSEGDADIYMGAINVINGSQIIKKYAKDKKYKTSRDFNHPAMFVRTECYEQVGLYRLGNIHNDYEWYLRANKMGKTVRIIDTIITNYPTGGAGSVKSLKNTIKRIGTKYEIYKENGYSRLYFIECFVQEIAKYILLKG